MERYFGYMPNDFINGEGVSVSLWTAGCPHRCPGCHNSEMWDYEKGTPVPMDIKGQIIKAIGANNFTRNLSILGGEPLASYNIDFVNNIIHAVKSAYPKVKIYLWTGNTIEKLQIEKSTNNKLNEILDNIDVLIDGPFIQKKRDITLKLRGSTNQRILYKGQDF